ncbi:MAG: hypothetical protein M0P63_10470 [Azoarcus sp.]|nr:hypothetical protein [Azoarcus sp.]
MMKHCNDTKVWMRSMRTVAGVVMTLSAGCVFAASAAASTSEEVGHAVGSTLREVGQDASEVGREIGHGAVELGRGVGAAAKDAVSTVGKGAREAGHAARDGTKALVRGIKGEPAADPDK